MSPLPGTVELAVLTVVNALRNGVAAAAAGSAVPRSTAPAVRRIDVRDIRVMKTSETEHRVTGRVPVETEYGSRTRKVQAAEGLPRKGPPTSLVPGVPPGHRRRGSERQQACWFTGRWAGPCPLGLWVDRGCTPGSVTGMLVFDEQILSGRRAECPSPRTRRPRTLRRLVRRPDPPRVQSGRPSTDQIHAADRR